MPDWKPEIRGVSPPSATPPRSRRHRRGARAASGRPLRGTEGVGRGRIRGSETRARGARRAARAGTRASPRRAAVASATSRFGQTRRRRMAHGHRARRPRRRAHAAQQPGAHDARPVDADDRHRRERRDLQRRQRRDPPAFAVCRARPAGVVLGIESRHGSPGRQLSGCPAGLSSAEAGRSIRSQPSVPTDSR